MHNGGWFAISRLIFDHRVVGIHSRPFTDLEAWLWLLAEAAFEPTEVTISKHTTVVLDPGQLMHARSYLAKRWQWTEDKVRWFLKRLQQEAMIARHCNQQRAQRNTQYNTQRNTQQRTNQIQILSICNYRQYQFPRSNVHPPLHPAKHPAPPPASHPQVNKETNNIHDKRGVGSASHGSSYWQSALNPNTASDYQIDAGGQVVLMNGKRAEWLAEFGGNEKRLQWALKEIGPRIQPNAPRTIAVQIEAALAKLVGEKHDRDARYQQAAKSNSRARPNSEPLDKAAQQRKLKAMLGGEQS